MVGGVTPRGLDCQGMDAAVCSGHRGYSRERYAPGEEVQIGRLRFRLRGVLGRGSFSEVWCGEALEPGPRGEARVDAALKDIACNSTADLQQAVLEASLLERFQKLATWAPGQGAPIMRIPRYLAHTVERRRNGGWRVRMAMSRVPGECLDQFLRRHPPPNQDGPGALRQGCALAAQLVRQLAPTLERIAHHAWHRDVNSHNVLIGDAVDSGKLRITADPEDTARRASFWLIDFGLAVDASTWPMQWPHADVAGDCRYWPPSSFLMSFYGPEETAAHKGLCEQYQTRLDVAGLGLTALEVLCSSAMSGAFEWGSGLHGSWKTLFTAWERYWEEVTRWHTMIFQVFSTGGDISALYQQLGQENVVDRVAEHVTRIRSLLRACAPHCEGTEAKNLVAVIADMVDENSSIGMREVSAALGPDPYRGSMSAPRPSPVVGHRQPLQPDASRPPASPLQRQESPRPTLRWQAPRASMQQGRAPPAAAAQHKPHRGGISSRTPSPGSKTRATRSGSASGGQVSARGTSAHGSRGARYAGGA